MKQGFTLIELLVVISIIGVLAGLLLPNFVGVRERASDATLKNDLRQLKSALRLYYNDYQAYPGAVSGNTGIDCDPGPGVSSCGSAFTVNGTVYMKKLPAEFFYYTDTSGTGERFLLTVSLNSAADDEIARSQQRCVPTGHGYTYSSTPAEVDYFVCED